MLQALAAGPGSPRIYVDIAFCVFDYLGNVQSGYDLNVDVFVPDNCTCDGRSVGYLLGTNKTLFRLALLNLHTDAAWTFFCCSEFSPQVSTRGSSSKLEERENAGVNILSKINYSSSMLKCLDQTFPQILPICVHSYLTI